MRTYQCQDNNCKSGFSIEPLSGRRMPYRVWCPFCGHEAEALAESGIVGALNTARAERRSLAQTEGAD